MVYLREVIRNNKIKLKEASNIELAAYLSISDPTELMRTTFDLTPHEEISLKGFKGEIVETSEITSIINRKAIRGVSATSNIYKFTGLYLAAKNELQKTFDEKFNSSNIRQQYFLAQFAPAYLDSIRHTLNNIQPTADTILLKEILFHDIHDPDLNEAVIKFIEDPLDAQELIMLEALEKKLIKTKYINQNADELVRGILHNFENAVLKVIGNRRSGHASFEIKDEYDVQDLLYVVVKSVFPNARDEDPIAKVGGKSTKIDLIIREESILIEVKMLKASDSNETHFIEDLKVDFESYHKCQWLKRLFCLVYDPFMKTKDISNFKDLNGKRTKGVHEFDVEVIVIN